MTDDQPTLKEWLEHLKARLGNNDTQAFSRASHKWPEKSPYGIVGAGAPRPWGWFLIWGILIGYWLAVQVYNQYLRQVLANYPEYLSEIDMDYVQLVNDIAFYAGVAWFILTAVMFFYMTLNTWGDFDTQIEPCTIWTLEGKPLVVPLRLKDNEEIWPLPQGHELIKFLERLEEEEMKQYVGTTTGKGSGDTAEKETATPAE